MNSKEHKEYLIAFKEYAQKITSSKKEAKDFLVRSGIHDRRGKLSKEYATTK